MTRGALRATLDPGVARFLAELPLAEGDAAAADLEALRQETRDFFGSIRPANLPDLADIQDLDVPMDDGATIRARFYQPGDVGGPIILYLHGGGWTTGDIDTHDEIARALALDTNCRVISLDYRLAPEHRYPRPLLDCVAAWRWLARGGAGLIGPPAQIALAGDSSGGNLAAALSLTARDGHLARPIAQLLIYPSLDLTLASCAPSLADFASGYWLEEPGVQLFTANYVRNDADRRDPLVSPLLAERQGDLPRTMIVTAGHDPIRDDGDAYADRLVDAGATVVHLRYGSLIHGFIEFAPVVAAAMAARHEAFRIFGLVLRSNR